MPMLICRACKSYAGKAISYITDEKKAERIYTHALDKSRSLGKQFIETAKVYGKGDTFDERKYYHIKVSFEEKDLIENGGKLTPEIAEKIAENFLQNHYNGFEYVLAVHTDAKHLHAHAIINAVNFETGKKLQHSNYDLMHMKDEINDISERYSVSRFDWKKAVQQRRKEDKQFVPVTAKEFSREEKYIKERSGKKFAEYSWKEVLRNCIDEAKLNCKSRTEFQEYLKNNYDIDMPRNTANTVSFIHPKVGKSIRGNKLGTDYTSEAIYNALNKNLEIHTDKQDERKFGEISAVKNAKKIIDNINHEVEKISSFTNDNYRDEIIPLHDEQIDVRNALRLKAKEKAVQLVNDIESGACENKQIETHIIKLNEQLKTVSKKINYGYLPENVKATVDDIVKSLAADERIAELYKLWYELDKENLKNYTDKIPNDVPLENQKEFTSIKNTIIKAAFSLNNPLNDIEFEKTDTLTELPKLEPDTDINIWNKAGYKEYKQGKEYILSLSEIQDVEKGIELLKHSASLGFDMAAYYLGKSYLNGEHVQENVSKAIDWFTKAAEQGNQYATFKLGKIYSSEKYINNNLLLAEKWFKQAANAGNHYAQYALGSLYLKEKLYNTKKSLNLFHKSAQQGNQYALLKLGRIYLAGELVQKDVEHAIDMLERSALQNNSYAEYALGKLYLFGKDVSKDTEKALYYLNRSAEHENIYAEQLLEQYETQPPLSVTGKVFSLFNNLSRIITNKMGLKNNENDVDKKLSAKMAKKKAALGEKFEYGLNM